MRTNMLLFTGAVTASAALVLTGCTASADQTKSAGAGSPQASSSSATPTEAPGPCQDQFALTVNETPDFAPGTGYLVFTNTGDEPCSLVGVPQVALLTSGNTSVGTMSTSDAYSRATTSVTVAPGQSAYAWKHWITAEMAEGNCESPTAINVEKIEVSLEGATKPLTLALDLQLCTAPAYMTDVQIGPIDSEPRSSTKGI